MLAVTDTTLINFIHKETYHGCCFIRLTLKLMLINVIYISWNSQQAIWLLAFLSDIFPVPVFRICYYYLRSLLSIFASQSLYSLLSDLIFSLNSLFSYQVIAPHLQMQPYLSYFVMLELNPVNISLLSSAAVWGFIIRGHWKNTTKQSMEELLSLLTVPAPFIFNSHVLSTLLLPVVINRLTTISVCELIHNEFTAYF